MRVCSDRKPGSNPYCLTSPRGRRDTPEPGRRAKRSCPAEKACLPPTRLSQKQARVPRAICLSDNGPKVLRSGEAKSFEDRPQAVVSSTGGGGGKRGEPEPPRSDDAIDVMYAHNAQAQGRGTGRKHKATILGLRAITTQHTIFFLECFGLSPSLSEARGHEIHRSQLASHFSVVREPGKCRGPQNDRAGVLRIRHSNAKIASNERGTA
ncbi:hypothetical protein L209DRAFT_161366 [Thermothelomyces heterothallicus CBS 203.75]